MGPADGPVFWILGVLARSGCNEPGPFSERYLDRGTPGSLLMAFPGTGNKGVTSTDASSGWHGPPTGESPPSGRRPIDREGQQGEQAHGTQLEGKPAETAGRPG